MLALHTTCHALKSNAEEWEEIPSSWFWFDQHVKIQTSLEHHVKNADASRCKASLLSADTCGMVWGESESNTAKNIARQLLPS